MVKSSSGLRFYKVHPRQNARPRYDPRTGSRVNNKTRHQSEVNRIGVISRHSVHRDPTQRPIKRTWRPPQYKPPLFGAVMKKKRRRQDVQKYLAPPSKPYRPPQRRPVTPRPTRPPRPPSPPPRPPSQPLPPSYTPQYLPPAQPTPYQVRMSSPQPLTSRTAVITG